MNTSLLILQKEMLKKTQVPKYSIEEKRITRHFRYGPPTVCVMWQPRQRMYYSTRFQLSGRCSCITAAV